jgi:hypothetical protein
MPKMLGSGAPAMSVWLGLVVGSRQQWLHLSIIDLWLGFGLAFVVPLGLLEVRGLGVRLPAVPLQVGAGTLAVMSFAFGHGGTAAALVIPWFATSLVAAGAGLFWLIEARRLDLNRLLAAAGLGYLSFGAFWLVASRLGLRPMGFSPEIVELTGVHFLFAGFAGPLLALGTAESLEARSHRLAAWARCAGVGVVAAMPVVAIGFVAGRLVSSLGATMLAVSLWGLGSLMLPAAAALRTASRVLLGTAVVSVLLAMGLALEYAAGPLLGLPVLSVTRMAQVHGTANAIGFTGCAMLAFCLPSRVSPTPRTGL